jgi:hypothetical protein
MIDTREKWFEETPVMTRQQVKNVEFLGCELNIR